VVTIDILLTFIIFINKKKRDMDLFNEFFGNNRRKRGDDDFFHLINEMMRKYQERLDSDMRLGSFPNMDIKLEKGDGWVRSSGTSEDGSLKWTTFVRENTNTTSQKDIDEFIYSMFSQPHKNNGVPSLSVEQKISMYKQDLDVAIQKEDYEQAAKLRDIIKALEFKKD